jgi:hypothetical protein
MDDDNMRSASHRKQQTAETNSAPPVASKVDPIAVGLQQLFATVANEPVPDEFLALLDRIEAAERKRAADANAAPTSDTTGSSI